MILVEMNEQAECGWRLRRPAADRHTARCACRDLCSGVRPRLYTPSNDLDFPSFIYYLVLQDIL